MDRNFARALKLVLKHEGGYVNHPSDPGGPTNKGITIATFRKFVNSKGTVDDLKRITDEQVAKVYRRQYWDAVKCDELPDGIDYAVFDFSVNSGPGRAAKYLQAALGVAQDGKIGPATIAAAKGAPQIGVILKICNARMSFLRGLKTWPKFGTGWSRRVEEVRTVALDMVQGAPAAPVVPPAAPAPVPPPAPKAPEPVVVPVAPKKHWLVVVLETILGWLKR